MIGTILLLLAVAAVLGMSMATTFTYPTAAELKVIEQAVMPVMMAGDPLFDVFPVVESQSHILKWRQADDFLGLQQIRGLGGSPGRVQRVGGKEYIMEPGVYGEFTVVDETEMTVRSRWAGGSTVPVTDLVMECQKMLLKRRLDRIRYIGWKLLTTGTFSVSMPYGTAANDIAHTDTYSVQTSSGSAWGTPASGTPLKDFLAIKLLGRGKGVSFGIGAKAFMSQETASKMLLNANAADLYGRRLGGGDTFNSIQDVNRIMLANGLPEIVVFDEGYIDDTGTFQLWLPVNKTVIVGKRADNAPIAEYRMTLNIAAGGQPGAYAEVVDKMDEKPPKIEVHDGHNGGPVMYYPSGVVILTTS